MAIQPRSCEICGMAFTPKANNVAKGCGHTCSIQCRCIKAARAPKRRLRGVEHTNYRHGWFTGPRSQWNLIAKRAHKALQNAVRDGRITRQPCVDCGVQNAEGHHEDYSKPFDVKWLCRKCHMALHGYGGVAS